MYTLKCKEGGYTIFNEISAYELAADPFDLFDKQWAVVTAGTPSDCNAMITSWGSLGLIWNVPTITIFMRPTRYTYEYIQREKYFSVGFFDIGDERAALRLLGQKSGRDTNKMEECGLVLHSFDGVPAFRRSKLVFVCEKAYVQPLAKEYTAEGFYDGAHYPYDGDADPENFHHMIMGAVHKVYLRGTV